ncbi:MAG: Sir2 family NAD-dependent protein deacetylase [Phycisphaerae bacterium]
MSDAALARLIDFARSNRTVAFTGAGISTESGIADFRSPGGVWSRHQPIPIDDFLASHDARRRFWAARREMYDTFVAARPNAGHHALARLESAGRLEAVITQNIDELHQLAGSRRVLELHGTARHVLCLDCQRRYPAGDIQARLVAGEEVPTCDACGGWLKSATVSFGQALPADVLNESFRLAQECELFLAIGSSLVVQPASLLPAAAQQAGARLVILTRSETPLDAVADVVIHASIGETLAALVGALAAEGLLPGG